GATLRPDGRFVFGAMAFSPNGLWVAAGLMNGKVEVWDARTGEKVWDRGKHDGYVHIVGFGRDGRTLISGGNDGVGYLWDLRPATKSAAYPAALWDDFAGPGGPKAYGAM